MRRRIPSLLTDRRRFDAVPAQTMFTRDAGNRVSLRNKVNSKQLAAGRIGSDWIGSDPPDSTWWIVREAPVHPIVIVQCSDGVASTVQRHGAVPTIR